jgi:hypothetical protein
MPAGRPTDYTPELASRICDLIAIHPISVKRIVAQYGDLPDDSNIYRWLARYPEFRSQYLEAKETQALAVTDELWDELSFGLNKEELDVFDRKFRFQQWHLSKLAPKQFGDKKEIKSEVTANVKMHEDRLKELE